MSNPTQLSLIINISNKAHSKLKAGRYHLCLCKKVNDTYNTIWFGSSRFNSSNKFQWVESYAVFGTIIKSGSQSSIGNDVTEFQDIGFNQTCNLDKYAIMNPAKGSKDPGVEYFTVEVDCTLDDLHIGVGQALTVGGNGKDSRKHPIYLSGDVIPSTLEFTPRNSLMIFFDNKLETGMTFEKVIRHFAEVDCVPGTTSRCSYNDDMEWITDGDEVHTKCVDDDDEAIPKSE